MDSIPSNYFMTFSKIKEYLSGWIASIDEEDFVVSGTKNKRCHTIFNKMHKEEVIFSHEYDASEKFSDDTIVGTNEIKDHCLSMMINQIVGFDIQEGKFEVTDQPIQNPAVKGE